MSDLVDLKMDEFASRDLAQFEARNPGPKVVDTPLYRNMQRIKRTVSAAKNELKLSGMDTAARDALKVKILDAAKVDLQGMIAAEKERVASELSKQAESMDRDRRLNSTKYEARAREMAFRYSSFTDDEVKMEAARLMKDPAPIDPLLIDTLSVQLKGIDKEEHAKFRNFVKESRLYEGHRHTPEGRQLAKYEAELDKGLAADGEVPIMYDNGLIQRQDLGAIIGSLS